MWWMQDKITFSVENSGRRADCNTPTWQCCLDRIATVVIVDSFLLAGAYERNLTTKPLCHVNTGTALSQTQQFVSESKWHT
jgi:hypothetical protein